LRRELERQKFAHHQLKVSKRKKYRNAVIKKKKKRTFIMYLYLHKKLKNPSLSMVFYPLLSNRKDILISKNKNKKEEYFFPPL